MSRNTIAFLSIVIVIVCITSGCSGGGKDTGTLPGQDTTLKGVSLSPRSYDSADFIDFLNRSRQTGKAISWAGDWNELSGADTAPAVVMSLSLEYGYVPVIEAQFFTQSTGKPLRPIDRQTKEDYVKYAASFAEKYRPPYLGLGIEVNVLHERSPQDFEDFVSLYDEAYDAVKAGSPDTKVFTIFQLERMKGLKGGLFGGKDDPASAEWELLDRFPRSDLVAFTTYPGLVFKDPSEIPSDYYAEIREHTSKPVAFTEIGWQGSSSIKGWESDESEQATFVERFFILTGELKPELEIWSFMYDQDVEEPFKDMGLRRSGDGGPKLAWDKWVSF